MLYTDEIRKVLEVQEGRGRPRLFPVEYYCIKRHESQPEEIVWGVVMKGASSHSDFFFGQVARLAAQIAVALMKAGFKAEDVVAFGERLELINPDEIKITAHTQADPLWWPVLCWPNYPNKNELLSSVRTCEEQEAGRSRRLDAASEARLAAKNKVKK